MDTIRIPLSPFQIARFAAFNHDAQQQQAAIQARANDSLTAIVASVVDPSTLTGWDVQIVDGAIVCVPPKAEGPQLVAETG